MIAPRAYRAGLALVAGALLLSSACGYQGAIYSSYQEGGLGVRTTADSSAPVKVHFGYDHSVAAFVPRRGGDAANEEATAIIAKDEVAATIALPAKIDPSIANASAAKPKIADPSTRIAVDSAFITGTAAIVASAPEDAKVTVCAPRARPGTTSDCDAAPELSFIAQGSAGERIGMALTQHPGQLTPAGAKITIVVAKIREIQPVSRQDRIWDRAAMKLSADFQRTYQSHVDQHEPRQLAFTEARLDGNETDERVLAALSSALTET